MTNRVVSIVLRGEIGDFVGKMTAASRAGISTAKSLTDGSKEAVKYRSNLTTLGTAAGGIGLVAAAGVGLAVRAYANFDQAIANVAATGSDARGSLDALRQAALDAGQRTVFSATEAAGAIENLAKAGLSAKDILGGGLSGALDLAAAGGLEVGQAAEIAATALNQFGLAGSDIPHVADLLAAGAGKAAGDVSDLGAALAQSGLVANQTGLTIDETTAALAAFASQGLIGSDAGTSLKSALQALVPSSAAAKAAVEQYNLSAFDQQGNFIGLEKYAGKLQAGLSGLSVEQRNSTLKTIFGSDAIRAASVLYEQGATGIADWEKKTNDAGYAAETAAIRLDTLKGDLEGLSGSFETAFIGTGAGADGPLRELVQTLTSLVNVYNELPGPIKGGVLATLGLTAAIGGSVFAASRAVSAYASISQALSGVGVTADGTGEKFTKTGLAIRGGALLAAGALASLSGPAHEANQELGGLTDVAAAAAAGFAVGGPWGAAIGGGVGLLGTLAKQSGAAADSLGRVTSTLDAQTGAINQNTTAAATKALQDDEGVKKILELGVSLSTVTDAALGNKAAYSELEAATADLGVRYANILDPVTNLRDGIRETAKANVDASKAATDSVAANGDVTKSYYAAAEGADGLATNLGQLDEASQAAQDSAKKTAASFLELSTTIDSGNTFDQYIDGLEKAAKAQANWAENIAKAQTQGLNQDYLDSIIAKGPEAAGLLDELANSSESDIKRINDAFANSEGVQDFAAKLQAIPPGVVTEFRADTDEARQHTLELKDKYNLTEEEVVTLLKANDQSSGDVKALLGLLAQVEKERVAKLKVQDNATSVIRAAVQALSLFNSKSITIRTYNETYNKPAGGGREKGVPQAHGSVLDFYANGGIRSENHVAQIAPAGAMRVWAEPETEGEAYIPFAMSKRKRSQEIAIQTVSRLGGVAAFADGGFSGRAGSKAVADRPIEITVNPSSPLNEAELARIVASQLNWAM